MEYMQQNKSILWQDSTLDNDRALVGYLVEKIVAGKTVHGHYDQCIEKIMVRIQTEEWQEIFPQRTYIFSIYYGLKIKEVIEVAFSLHAQALELLYFNIATKSDGIEFIPDASFSKKLAIVFKDIYKWKMPEDTANAIRILRNDTMHTGTIAGVIGTYSNPNDPIKLNETFDKYQFGKNQKTTEIQNRMHLAHLFNLLLEDMMIRTLGLEQEDLSMNLSPIWNSELFGYEHDSRPEWLRY